MDSPLHITADKRFALRKNFFYAWKQIYEIRKPAFHGKETVNYDDVVAFV